MIPFLALTDATWPAVAIHRAGAFLVREGGGGGQRVSSATASGPWSEADIDRAIAMQARLAQTALFLVQPAEAVLDAALAARGLRIKDPVNVYAAPVADLTVEPAVTMTAFTIWPPLAIMRDLWIDGGIGPERVATMERVNGPKTAVLGRANDRASGAAFVAIHEGSAMLHALHVLPGQRRQGSAVKMMRAAAHWAQDQGAERFFVLVTAANAPANALYASLGMQIVGHYHYRSE